MAGMHTDLILIASLMDLTIAFNIVMIGYAFAMEPRVMTGSESIDREALVAAGCTAVNANKGYFSTHKYS